jgi:hypothetical protein
MFFVPCISEVRFGSMAQVVRAWVQFPIPQKQSEAPEVSKFYNTVPTVLLARKIPFIYHPSRNNPKTTNSF